MITYKSISAAPFKIFENAFLIKKSVPVKFGSKTNSVNIVIEEDTVFVKIMVRTLVDKIRDIPFKVEMFPYEKKLSIFIVTLVSIIGIVVLFCVFLFIYTSIRSFYN